MTSAAHQGPAEPGAGQVVVTGVAGSIGAAVAGEFIRNGVRVTGVDRRDPGAELGGALADFVLADAADATQLAPAFRGRQVDAVVHLAAIPAPIGDPSDVFTGNTAATFNVLHQAGLAGARAMLLASSISALGMVYAPESFSPLYVPVDELHPLRPADPYALSKQADELTGAMMARVFGTPALSFRFPYTTTAERIAERAAELSRDPAGGARDLWAYLDLRDAARACVEAIGQALAGGFTGAPVLNIVADDALVDEPLDELIRRFHPSTELRAPLGRRVSAFDTAAATRLLGFRARYLR